MPIPVTCTCGKRFSAKDELAGRRLKCPSCGGPIDIPQPAQPSDGGLDLGDLSQFEGAAANPLGPAPANPLGGSAYNPPTKGQYGQPAHGTLGAPATARPAPSANLGLKVALFGGGAAGIVVVLALGIFVLLDFSSAPVAQQQPATSPPPSPPATGNIPPAPPSVSSPPTVSPAPVPPGAAPRPGSSPPPSPSPPASTPPAPKTPAPDKRLPTAVLAWHAHPEGKQLGAWPVKGEEVVVYQYSWMCDLLPHLGHEKLYHEFNFKQPWTNDPNLSLTRVVVPQFLNPLDDRRQWRGYPFQGLALTHFVGISGVEDQRNVLAAELPRTDPRAGVFGYHGIARPEEITDGTSQTLMIIGSGELASPWVQGGGATVRGARAPYFDPLSGFGSRGGPQPGALTMFADGAVRRVSADIDPKVFRAMCTIRGGESVDLPPLGASLPDFPSK